MPTLDYRGHTLRIDWVDLPLLEDTWTVAEVAPGFFYLLRTVAGRTLLLHRHIMRVTERAVLVDHRNKDTLDNRRSNLRIVTPHQNMMNSVKVINPGVGLHRERWRARLWMPDGRRWEKSFDTRAEAEAWWYERHAERMAQMPD
jgi:hypothetical protein